MGGGVQYSLSESMALVAGLIYRQGFKDITDNDAVKISGTEMTSEDSKAIIKIITLRIGLLF